MFIRDINHFRECCAAPLGSTYIPRMSNVADPKTFGHAVSWPLAAFLLESIKKLLIQEFRGGLLHMERLVL